LPAFALTRLLADPEPEVRRIVAARALPHDALLLLADEDWLVRLAAVQRAPFHAIRACLSDPEPDVRRAAWERLAGGDGDKQSMTENTDEPMG
jgi:HEAT repeat protein